MSGIMTKSRKSLNRLSIFFNPKVENSSDSLPNTSESPGSPLLHTGDMPVSNWPLPEPQPYQNRTTSSPMHLGSSGQAPNSELPPLPAFAQQEQRPRSATRDHYGSNMHSGLSTYANRPQSKSVTSFSRPQTAPYQHSSKKSASTLALEETPLPPLPPLPNSKSSQPLNVLRKPQDIGLKAKTSTKNTETKRKTSFFGRRRSKEQSNQNTGPAAWFIGSEQKIPYDLNALLGGAMVYILFIIYSKLTRIGS
jgi:hypothetical protein